MFVGVVALIYSIGSRSNRIQGLLEVFPFSYQVIQIVIETAPVKNSVKQHAHLVGLCGAGMRSLADYLLAGGWSVSGSDQSISAGDQAECAVKGMETFAEHSQQNVPEQTSLLVYSLAIPEENSERVFAVEQEIPGFSYVEYLGKLFEKHRGIGVAGSHGKTTTCAILSHLLGEAALNPSVVSGGRLQGEQVFGKQGSSQYNNGYSTRM